MQIKLALLACLAGCAPMSSNYDAMLADWRRDEHVHASTEPRVAALAGAATLDRRALIEAVLAANPAIEALRQAWRAALAEAPVAAALDDPTLSYEIAPLSIGSSTARFGQRVELRQRLPFPGKRALAGEVATADAEVARADYQAMRLAVVELASQLYDDAYVNARALEVNDQHRALVERMKQLAIARLASSRGSAQDALAAEVELGHLEHDRVMLDSERVVIAARINGLMHRAPDAPLPPMPSDLGVPDEPGALDQLAPAALAARPQHVAAEARAASAAARVARAERDYYPDVELMASYDSMWDQPAHRWMVGAMIDVPLSRDKRAAEVAAQRARVAQAHAEIDDVSDAIRVDLVRAQRELADALHVIQLYEARLLPAARAQVDAAIAGFAAGQNDFSVVIQAERSLRDIQLAGIRARADAWHRRAALDRAAGRSPGGAP